MNSKGFLNSKVFYHKDAGFDIGSIVGVSLNMWTGTLEFYLNRKSLGIAFDGLKNKILYPMISTESCFVMKLIFTRSEKYSLFNLAFRNLPENQLCYLPPGLKHFSRKWILSKQKSTDLNPLKISKYLQNYIIAMFVLSIMID